MIMDWEKLLNKERERKTGTKEEPFRNEFDKDYERVVSSSSLRRLQDKAQVFPLQENDFTRTRLTHSLEVSSIARSIGKRSGYMMREKNLITSEQSEELSSLLAVCGLVHDLGNPPFGHYGEDVIKAWFENKRKDDDTLKCLDLDDFCCFDGNAQTLRILTKLQYLKDIYGINFCYGTLGTLIKYPKSSKKAIKEKLNKRKLGYFKSEEKVFQRIVEKTGMLNKSNDFILRHPVTYLLEAADDISYLFADLEDAVKKDYAVWEIIKEDIFKVLNASNDFKNIECSINKMKEEHAKTKNILSRKETTVLEASYFRVLCQGKCIELVCNEFIENYEHIMNGVYLEKTGRKSLCDSPLLSKTISCIRDNCIKYAYQNSEVLSLEIIAKKVIESLLDKFVYAAISDDYNDKRTENGKLYSKISPNFILVQKFGDNGIIENKDVNTEERIRTVVDYISGMTDSYALNLHRILSGVKLP